MGAQPGDGVSKLSDIERTSDNYLNELYGKIHEVRQKLAEEKNVNGQLKEISCGFQGRIAVHYERSEDLGIGDMQEMMEQADMDLESAKEESFALSQNLFSDCNVLIEGVEDEGAWFEAFRNHFKSAESIEKELATERAKFDNSDAEFEGAENEMLETDNIGEELRHAMKGFAPIDEIIQSFGKEMEEINAEATIFASKVHSLSQRRIDYGPYPRLPLQYQ